jgi:hypothetical protein
MGTQTSFESPCFESGEEFSPALLLIEKDLARGSTEESP